MLVEVNSKEGAAGGNILMREGEELTRGHGALGATFCCGKHPAVAGGAANSGRSCDREEEEVSKPPLRDSPAALEVARMWIGR